MTSFVNKVEQSFDIEIEQDGKIITPERGIFKLHKRKFAFIIKLNGIEGVFLNASFKDTFYKKTARDPIDDFEIIGGKVLAEDVNNSSQELMMYDDAYSFWFDDRNDDFTRFDERVKVINDYVIGTKTINVLYLESTRTTVNIDLVVQPIYLFFFSVEIKDFKVIKELDRKKYKIEWLE
ncbi:MAG: hypothetical protein SGJ04_10075 [Bacteroidota bacterium]|nr:hypothetical protein [Bacteroidota bacterium]